MYIPKDNKQYFNNLIAKIMSDVFIVNLFYFQINKNITLFCCIESTFYRYARIYQTPDIEYSACILHIQPK